MTEAENLLRETSPEKIFGTKVDEAKRIWRALALSWHPDHNPAPHASEVFGHVHELYNKWIIRYSKSTSRNLINFDTVDNRQYKLLYDFKTSFDLGDMYLCRTAVAYVCRSEFSDLAEQSVTAIKSLKFLSDKMKESLSQSVPQHINQLDLADGSTVIVLKKEANYVPLSQVLSYSGGSLPPKHVAWMVSSMLNLLCYLEVIKRTHNAINVENLLVDAANHSIAIYGGWQYSTPQGEKLKALPARSIKIIPPDILDSKKADSRLDQFLVRETARTLLGKEWKNTPNAMRNFIELPPTHGAISNYEYWGTSLHDSFGPRKFIVLDIAPEEIYRMKVA